MDEHNEINRLRQEYSNRKTRANGRNLYSLFYPPYLFSIQQRQRSLIKDFPLKTHQELDEKKILEIGCGGGGVLLEYLTLGAAPDRIHGIDLLFDRLQTAKNKLPNSGVCCADGQNLPFSNNSFDLVLQYTAFSSILVSSVKQSMANEMLRVLHPSGSIIWYDFWTNPFNKQTKGIRASEIRSLFPNCIFDFHKITLAPPIARRVVPFSWSLGMLLESLRIFNTHFLVFIHKKPTS